MRTVLLVLSAAAAAALIAALVAGRMFVRFVDTPHAAQGAEPRTVVVARDVTPEALAGELVSGGIIGDGEWFTWYLARWYRGPALQPGEYAVSASMSPAEIVDRIARGQVTTYPITVSPGETSRAIVAALVAANLGTRAELEAALSDAGVTTRLGVPGPTLEGFLFADTYSFAKGLAPEAIWERMVRAHQNGVPAKLVEDARTRGYTELELITVASLIETSGLTERDWPQYSGLIRNRLDDDLPLEHEGALGYALDKKREQLTDEDREAQSPYNTFSKKGLPPTPIASPGLSAIAAAAAPVGDARYVMPRGEGGASVFCPDEECHHLALERAGRPIPRSLTAAPKKKKGR